MAKYKVLSTKKLEPSLIEHAKQNHIEIIDQEFISVKPVLTFENINRFLLLLKKPYAVFTSANAVTSFTCYLHPGDPAYKPLWKIFCLGGKTKEAVLKIRSLKKNIVAEANNATDLAHKIIEREVKEIVFCCGDRRRDELPDILKKAGITIHELVVYETVETPSTIATDDIDAILFFSPSAVKSFFSVNQLKKTTVCFAIGQTTASSIADCSDNKIIISESPSQEMMLASVHFYFQNINCHE
jgi:uroporphyrinogen-III synthase